MEFPKFAVFTSLTNKKYLTPEEGSDLPWMKFQAVDVHSWGVKHEVVKAKSDGGLIHIRCCDTGKYWRWGGDKNNYIVALENQPGEDTTTRACTLIRPSIYRTKDGVHFLNLHCPVNGSWFSIYRNIDGYLGYGGHVEDFILSDWEKLSPKQQQRPSNGDTNLNTDGGVPIENTNIGGGSSVENMNTGGVG